MAVTETDAPVAAPNAGLDAIVKLAVMAVGGQGGGVLMNWIVDVAERNGWRAQATSVAGVAQRTGATFYYIEMLPDSGREPVFALAPSAGDVDILIAAEMMEAGRAVMRGFVTPDRTTLIASTHRALAVAEKIVPGDGLADAEEVRAAAETAAQRFLAFDMERIARDSGTVISASLFGALAGAGVLPFPRESYEDTIRASGRGVEASLAAFARAFERAEAGGCDVAPEPAPAEAPMPAGPSGSAADLALWNALTARVDALPAPAAEMARLGLAKVVDFQDLDYGAEYLDRLDRILSADRAAGGEDRGFELTRTAAKHLANAMVYDDIVRVADLKTRSSRFRRVREHMQVGEDKVMHVTEFMHPRAQEVCATLPAGLGRWIEARPRAFDAFDRLVNRGRRVRTDRLHWFLVLYVLAGLRRWRRRLLRHEVERAHLDAWLDRALEAARRDYALGVEILACRRLIKGYSDTHARGHSKFDRVMQGIALVEGRDDAADWARRLREAALKDEKGEALDGALATIRSFAGEQPTH